MTAGQKLFNTPGISEWVVPSGITSISVVCVGGGGAGHGATGATGSAGSAGGGGALNWTNNHPVTPGEVLTIGVAFGGVGGSGVGTSGGDSFVTNDAGYICLAKGGFAGSKNDITPGGQRNEGFPSSQGGNGGNGGAGNTRVGNGGGGAGGYTGNGGTGSSSTGNGQAGSGGGGGGGARPGSFNGGGGGGVGVLGQGSNGAGGTSNDGNQFGRGGSGGTDAEGVNAGSYGGGGGAPDDNESNAAGGNGGHGAVRIMYGDNRTFPNPAGDVEIPPADPTDLFLVAGAPSEGEIKTVSTVPYSRWTEQNSTKISIWWDQDNQPSSFYSAPGNEIYLSDSSGNKIGTAEGVISGYFQAEGWLKVIDIGGTIPNDWPSTGYVTKVKPAGEPDYTQTFKVERQNLFNPEYQDCMVLVNEGSQSYNCLIKDLGIKNSPSRIMLVNQGSRSYKTSVTDVLEGELPPLPTPTIDLDANTYGSGSLVWSDSSGNGNNLTFSQEPNLINGSSQNTLEFENGDWGYCVLPEVLPGRTVWCYEAWVQTPVETNPNSNIICQMTNNTTSVSPSQYDLMLYHYVGKQMVVGLYNGTGVDYTVNASDDDMPIGYKHYVAMYDGTAIRLYQNGVQYGNPTNSVGQSTTNLRVFRVGGTYNNSWPGGISSPVYATINLQRLRVWYGSFMTINQIQYAYQEFLSKQS